MNRSLIIILTILIICACNQQKGDKIKAFRVWFDKNKKHFEGITSADKDVKRTMLIEQLHEIDPGLSAEISTDIKELIISAEGDTNIFSLVEELVRQAPPLEEWDVTAFKQPTLEDFTLEYQDISLTPSELFFLPIEENNHLDIIIYGLGFDKYNHEKLSHYGLIMLDKVMGEYNCAKKVRYYDFKDLKEVKNSESLIPLLELNDYVEAFHASKNETNI